MAIIALPTTFTDGTIPTAAQFNGDFTTIVNDYNGNITNANIAASAGIAYSKLNLTGSVTAADLTSDAVSVSATDIEAASGIPIQVVLTNNTTQFTWGDTGVDRFAFQGTITPKKSTSTIYAILVVNGIDNAAAGRVLLTLKHETVSGGTSGTSLGFANVAQNSTGSSGVSSATILGSVTPGDTTQRFFKLIYSKQDAGGTNYINEYNETSSILLVEVA